MTGVLFSFQKTSPPTAGHLLAQGMSTIKQSWGQYSGMRTEVKLCDKGEMVA